MRVRTIGTLLMFSPVISLLVIMLWQVYHNQQITIPPIFNSATVIVAVGFAMWMLDSLMGIKRDVYDPDPLQELPYKPSIERVVNKNIWVGFVWSHKCDFCGQDIKNGDMVMKYLGKKNKPQGAHICCALGGMSKEDYSKAYDDWIISRI